MSSNEENVFLSSLKLAAAKGLNTVLVFGGTTLFARLIGADQLGIYFLFEGFLGLFAMFTNFGLSGALEKRLSEGVDREQYLASASVLKALIVLVLSAVVVVARGPINDYLNADLALLLIVAIVLNEAGRVFFHTLRGEIRVGDTSTILVAKQFMWVSIGGTLTVFGFGYLAPLYGFLCGLGAVLALSYMMADTSFGRPSVKHMKSLLHFSKFDFISSSIGWQVYNSVDILLIGYFLTSAAVSHYEIAWRVSTVVMIATAAVSEVVFPSFSKLVEKDRRIEIQNTVRWSLGVGFLLSVPSLAGVLVLGEPMLQYIFGPEYLVASLVLVVLVADKSSHAVQSVLAQVVRAYDRPDVAAGITGSSIVANVAANLLLIPRFGLIGAAVATTASYALATTLYVVVTRRFITIGFPWKIVGWQILSATVMAVVIHRVKTVYPISSALELLAYVLFGALIYAVGMAIYTDTRELLLRTAGY